MSMSSFAVNRVQQPAAAGKLTDRRSPHALLRSCTLTALVALTVALLAVSASSAFASPAPAPGWTIESFAAPAHFTAAQNTECLARFSACESYVVKARNAGSVAATDTEPAVLQDTVPAGLTVHGVALKEQTPSNSKRELGCVTTPSPPVTHVVCTLNANPGEPGPVQPDEELVLEIFVTVDEETPKALPNEASIEGGGAPPAKTEAQEATNSVGEPVGFGFYHIGAYVSSVDGTRDLQAGDHPYEATFTLNLNTKTRFRGAFEPEAVQDVRDFVTDLPVGFVGSILAAPQCSFAQLTSHIVHGIGGCPVDTIVGHLRTEPEGITAIDGPIYNMTPEEGYPAEFAYVDVTNSPHVFYSRVVPTAQGYVLQTINPEIPQIALHTIVVTFFGDPTAKYAGTVCGTGSEEHELLCREGLENGAVPFFTDPTDCTGEEPTTTIWTDSWQNPAKWNPDGTPVDLGEAQWAKSESKSHPVIGCNMLRFPAQIEAQPTTHESDKPSGMNFFIKLPQSETMGVPATPTLKKVFETFPGGFTVDPSAAGGLGACSEAQMGWVGPGPLSFNEAPPACPEGSKIGSLELESPLIGKRKLQGEMFLARQYENPYPEPGHPTGSLIGLYVVVHDPLTGVLIKIAGRATLNPNNGQITGEFNENPNLPFSNLELHFFGGPRAEFATPESCGTFTTTTELEPWSAPDSGLPASPFNNFLIDEACPSGSFSPPFTAGSQNLQAGGYTNFVASFQRSDTEQELAGLTVTLPPGLSANVANVPECSEAQIHEAEAGTGGCPENTQVGTVQAGVGPGPDPYFAQGKAYWTGPYKGGPFGIAVVVPAVAGPFNFGTVVVRQSIHLDPHTAQVTDVSDPFPTIIDGIPLRMRRVDVEFNRFAFIFNPTSCAKNQFTGIVSGFPLGAPTEVNQYNVGFAQVPGATHAFTAPFQVTNCANLKFAPKVAISTSGKTSRANGASLTYKLTYPGGGGRAGISSPQGVYADIAKVKVELPKQLPSRLTTLQKACTQAQFSANPAGCPSASLIGRAKAVVPNIPVPLEGPVYFVSNGGEAFPNLVIVLQGDNVTIDLTGDTFISKSGITSTTFKTVPDNPLYSFEINLPQGKYSALAANGNLCKSKLTMPNEYVAQNGLKLNETLPIAVTGCKHAKVKHKHHKRKRSKPQLSRPGH